MSCNTPTGGTEQCQTCSGAYNLSNNTCFTTNCTIANCNSCFTMNGAEQCQSCSNNLTVWRNQCLSTTCTIPNCAYCETVNGTEMCRYCSGGLALSNNTCVTSPCSSANEFECTASVCAIFTFSSGSCSFNSGSTCVNSESVPNGSGGCTACAGLMASTCSSTCYDWVYNTSSNACVDCSATYGADCIQCSMTECTICSFSSGKVLATDKLSCVPSSCTITDCI